MLVVATVVAVLSLLLGAWAGARLARDRPVILRQLIAGGVVELALLVQVVTAAVQAGRGHVLADPVTFWGYLVFALVVLPAAAVWAFADRTRWSSAVLLVACLTLAVMELRMVQVWARVLPL